MTLVFMQTFSFHSLVRGLLLSALFLVHARAHGQSIYRDEISIPGEMLMTATHTATLDGGLIVATKSQDIMSPTRYINLLKLDSTGTMQWQKSFGPVSCTFENIVQSPDSGFFICATGFSAMSYLVLKTDKNGTLQYSRRLQVPAPYIVLHEGKSLAKNGGGFFIYSTLFDSSTTSQCWHLLELDAVGNTVSSNVYDLYSGKTRCYGIDTCRNGDVVLVGSVFTSPVHSFLVSRIDNTGALVWSNAYNNAPGFSSMPCDIACDTADHIFVATQYNSTLTPHVGLTKIDGAGNELWTMEYADATTALRPKEMMLTDAGEIVIVGEEFFMKVDPTGSPMIGTKFLSTIFFSVDAPNAQTFQLSGNPASSMNCLVMTTDALGQGCGDTALSITKTPRTLYDSIIASTAPVTVQNFVYNLSSVNKNIQLIDDCDTTTTVAENETYNMLHVYPNPASGRVSIRSAETMYSAELFTVTGQVLLTHTQTAREYQLDISSVPAGCYILSIRMENNSKTLRLVVE